MPITPITSTLITSYEQPAVTLARYAQRIDYPECAFFGVNHEDTNDRRQCRNIWSEYERNNIGFYLMEAQREIEKEVRFPLAPTWITGDVDGEPLGRSDFVDVGEFKPKMLSKWTLLLQAGIRAREVIESGATVDQSSDPSVVTIAGVTDFDMDELLVLHPDSDYPIIPSAASITAGTLTIEIPRCRTVKPAVADNPKEGLDYNDLSNFADEVDVLREYNDPSVNAKLLRAHSCSASCSSDGCTNYEDDACIRIMNPRIGSMSIFPASYSVDNGWVASGYCHSYTTAKLNYQAGMKTLTKQAEDAIIRLAHSKMPDEPCGCNVTQKLWMRDRNIPETLTRERVNCPFGMSDGAWIAWRFAQTMRVVRASVL